jgi:hypothetical protein
MNRTDGVTIVELVVALAVATVFFATVWTSMVSQTEAVDASFRVLTAQNECDRATLTLIEDLQTTNTVESDPSGTPYFTVTTPGPRSRIDFRRVEGQDVNVTADIVTARYGEPVTYALNNDDQLVRSQGGRNRVVANRVSTFEVTVAPDGTINFTVVAYAGMGEDRVEIANGMSVTPRNGYDR